jgi:hypothetical protein
MLFSWFLQVVRRLMAGFRTRNQSSRGTHSIQRKIVIAGTDLEVFRLADLFDSYSIGRNIHLIFEVGFMKNTKLQSPLRNSGLSDLFTGNGYRIPSAICLLVALLGVGVSAQNVWTHHNDNGRTGANLQETQLSTSTVNVNQFGKLYTYIVDADVYTQPLVIQNVTIPGRGVHDVVYVATMNNSVYAFDAASQSSALPLWQVNFNNPAAGIGPVPGSATAISDNIRPGGSLGIMGTPVIDESTGTMYLVARTALNGGAPYSQYLHALDITTGAEKFGGPVLITASVPGSGLDAVSGVVTFNPLQENQRAALALANGNVYIAWASQGDYNPYHGWVIAYNAQTLQKLGSAFNTSPDGSMAGIWQSGQGPIVDASGNVYYMLGNGSFSADRGGRNYGESLVKLDSGLQTVLDWFVPSNWNDLNGGDVDFGSSGPLLLPNTNYAIGGGKSGIFFLLNTNNLGHYALGNTQIVQSFSASSGGEIHGGPVYWQGPLGRLLYIWPALDYLKAFSFNGAIFQTTPVSQSTYTAPAGSNPGGILSISADGSQAGSGILWASLPYNADAESGIVSGVLRAFDASNLANELWNSRMNLARDDVGNFAKFVPPTVANGRVFVPTFSNQLLVYGLLNSPPPASGSLTGSGASSSASVNMTTTGTADWALWPGYVHKATGGSQIPDLLALGAVQGAPYNGDARVLTWSDGTPTASGSSTAGFSLNNQGNGFVVSAPADTTLRILQVYVGGWASTGQLTAQLSDGSAPVYVDSHFSSSTGSYNAVYTLTYSAGSPNQRLYVTWQQVAGGGNLDLQGATLALAGSTPPPPPPPAPPAAPTGVTASQGTSTTSVTIAWNSVATATSYTVYRSATAGSTGSSIGSTATTSLMDSTVTPGTTYYYSVTASNAAGPSPSSPQVSGYAAVPVAGLGSLTGTVLTVTSPVNLTTTGTLDWAHWYGYDHKATGGGQISNFTLLGGGTAGNYSGDARTLTWTDGTPTPTGSNTNGVSVWGKAYRFTVPADGTQRTVTVYVSGWASSGQLTATLSDGSATAYTSPVLSGAGTYDGAYSLTYSAASTGQQLVIVWQQVGGGGNLDLQGAALR